MFHKVVHYIQQPTRVVGSPATLIDNIFMNSVEFVTVSSNLLCQLVDHLLQFFVLKDFRVSYRPKYEQIFKRNYRSFKNNEFKNEINQIDWKTLFGSPDINLCFEKFLHICICVFDDHAPPIKKISKKEKSHFDKPWIDNYLRHLMCIRDACFIKYYRARKAIEKLKIHTEYKTLRNEVKMKTKQAKKNCQDLFEKNKTDLLKTWEVIRSIVKVGRKK